MTDAPVPEKSVSDLCAEIVSLQFRLDAALAEIDRLTALVTAVHRTAERSLHDLANIAKQVNAEHHTTLMAIFDALVKVGAK